MDLGFSTINTLDKRSGLSTPATRIRRLTDGYHWSVLDHVLFGVTAVRMSATKDDYDYNYKTEIQIWKGNQEFERQIFS